jgi:hypothetical protein
MADVETYLQTVPLEPEHKEHIIERHISTHFPYKSKFCLNTKLIWSPLREMLADKLKNACHEAILRNKNEQGIGN